MMGECPAFSCLLSTMFLGGDEGLAVVLGGDRVMGAQPWCSWGVTACSHGAGKGVLTPCAFLPSPGLLVALC